MPGEHATDATRSDEDDDPRGLARRQLGGAIRRRRHAASLTLATVSERAGISVSMLSQVERGLLDPSLDTLRNIADALGTAPFRLLAEEASPTAVVRRAQRRTRSDETAELRTQLASPSSEGAFEVAIWELRAHSAKLGTPRAQPGEEAALLLQGRALLEIDDERIELAEGDCVTFDPRKPYRMTALGDEPVVCVGIVCPPAL